MSDRLYKKVINHYGAAAQKYKAIEECNELINAINANDRENIKEEIADVLNMSIQLAIIYDIPRSEIRNMAVHKMNRTNERIQEREKCCENCKHSVDYGESVEYIWCEKVGARRKSVKKSDRCTLYEEAKTDG